MPRKLPWLVDDVKDSKESKTKSDIELPRQNRLRTDDITGEINLPDDPTRRVDFLRSSRSPPTSPIQEPLNEELMREGLDRDDKYIMVEDEFYAIAQTFTRHLHHAEYIRRKKLAKAENARVINDIVRPTDGRTKMRPEIVKQKEIDRLHDRQRKSLARSANSRPRVDSEEESEAENTDPDIDLADDPWVGTSLHDFMVSPRKAKSLIGLESIKSSTRAAAGYRKASDKCQRSVLYPPSKLSPVPQSSGGQEETASEDDDLEALHREPTSLPDIHAFKARAAINRERRQAPVVRPAEEFDTTRFDQKTDLNAKKVSVPRASTVMDKRKKTLFDELDDFSDEAKIEPQYSMQDQPPKLNSTRAAPTESSPTRDSKKSRLNDVPTFLVR